MIETIDDLDYSLLELEPRLNDLDIPTLSVLNLGAGNGESTFGKMINHLPFASLTNVEVYKPSLDILYDQYTAAKTVSYINEDALDFVKHQPDKEFYGYDVALLIDILEHFSKADALELLFHLKRITRKRIILWLPFGFCPQDGYDGNDWQEHLSEWYPEDFPPPAIVDICWKHFHVISNPDAGFVTINL